MYYMGDIIKTSSTQCASATLTNSSEGLGSPTSRR
jgi:hypothetical protein